MDRVERYRLLLKRWGLSTRGRDQNQLYSTVHDSTVQYYPGGGALTIAQTDGADVLSAICLSLIFDVSAQALWSEAVLYCLRVSQSNMSSLSNHLRDHP